MTAFGVVVCATILCTLVQSRPIQRGPPAQLKEAHDQCQANQSTHVTADTFKAFHKGEPVDRQLLGDHLLCMAKKLGTQNEDGTINRQGLKDALASEVTDATKLEEIVNKCAVDSSSPGETALEIVKCVRENVHPGHGHGHHHGHDHDHYHGHDHDHHHHD